MTKYRPGVGAVTAAERRGFSERDQARAIAECKTTQFTIQRGLCIWCQEPTPLRMTRWVSARGAASTLTEWSKRLLPVFDPATLSNELHHRSPDEIRAEYANGNNGHELACRGCAMRFHHTLYGENGAGAAYGRRYARLVAERGIPEDQLHDPAVASRLHYEVVEYLGQSRAARLAEVSGTVEPEDVEPRVPKKRKGKRARRPGRSRGNELVGPDWVRPGADEALRYERELQAARPESDLERQTRELLESLAPKRP